MADLAGDNKSGAGAKARPQFRNLDLSQLASYKLPLPGIVSILHRVSGAVMFLFGIPILLWLFQLSLTSEISFDQLREVGSHWFVRLVLVGLSWAFLHHLFAGIRYLVLDLHIGIDKPQANSSATAVFVASGVATLVAAAKIFGVF